jgi:phosphate transport system substrate-binding protein
MNRTNYLMIMLLALGSFACEPSEEIRPLLINGSNGVRPLVEALGAAFQPSNSEVSLSISATMGSKERLEALAADSIDMAMASHGIDEKALEAAGFEVILFAQMPVVMAVHQSVGVDKLSSAQLCDIYSGNLTNWKDVGGNDLPIQALSRPFEEVDVEVILEHIPCFADVELDSSVRFEERSGDMARALASTPGSIGMTTMTRVTQSEGAFQAIALDGITPSIDNIKAGRYLLLRNSYLVVKKEHSSGVDEFLSFVLSEKGSRIIEKNEAIPKK